MKSKWILHTGIVLLTVGIILRFAMDIKPISLTLILTGVALKITYIVIKYIQKEYKPGYELLFLFVGLLFFMGGIMLHKFEHIESPTLMKTIGLSLKALFVFIFIRKVRKPTLKLTA